VYRYRCIAVGGAALGSTQSGSFATSSSPQRIAQRRVADHAQDRVRVPYFSLFEPYLP
jgi:hypothetical protein